AEALKAMGNAKYDGGDFAGAAVFYERALARRPDDADVRTDLGNTYFQRDPPDYRRAIIEYRQAVAIDPRHDKGWQNIAAAAIRLGDKEAARAAVERLATVNPQSPSLPALRQGLATLP
ncbi:MAG: tetratricopeptide repeat protein, partial [Pyrinomonadaceae bacterium]